MSLEDKLLHEAKRKEEELRREVERKEEQLKKEARLDIERKQAELRRKMEKIEAEREKLAREREQEKLRLEQEHLDKMRGSERGVPDLNEDRLRESNFGQHRAVHEQMNDERRAFLRDQELRQTQILEAQLRGAGPRYHDLRGVENLEDRLRAEGVNNHEIQEILRRQSDLQAREMHEREMRGNEVQELRERQLHGDIAMPNRNAVQIPEPVSLLDLPMQQPSNMVSHLYLLANDKRHTTTLFRHFFKHLKWVLYNSVNLKDEGCNKIN